MKTPYLIQRGLIDKDIYNRKASESATERFVNTVDLGYMDAVLEHRADAG